MYLTFSHDRASWLFRFARQPWHAITPASARRYWDMGAILCERV